MDLQENSPLPDFAGFDAAYSQYGDAIFRHLYFRTQDRERALELTQEVFTRFFEYLQRGNAVQHPRAFLYRSAHNAFVNDIRRPLRTTSLESLVEEGFDVAYSDADHAELERQREAISRLSELDGPTRDAITLRYVDGLKVKEIAALTGEKENTVSARITRGLKKLRSTYPHEH